MAENRRIFTFEADSADAGKRIDRMLAEQLPDYSREFLKRAIQEGNITADGRRIRPADRVTRGMTLRAELPESMDAPPPAPEEIPLDILHEDDALLVINKPAGMNVHPGAGNREGTLVSALLFREGEGFADIGDEPGSDRPGIVHRLDRDTSGALAVARTPQAFTALKEAFQQHQVAKYYLTVARGVFEQSTGTIDAPIGRDPRHRHRMAVLPPGEGREALTKYKVLARTHDAALLLVRIYTGRTHQIRVHLAHIGHPVMGDQVYGGAAPCLPFQFQRQLLHAWKLTLPHPVTGQRLTFIAPPPPDLDSAMRIFSRQEQNDFMLHA
jgi:23S rRNA pseudouridine1911/1915/1917 synthase